MKEINLKEILLSNIPSGCYWEEMENLTNCPISIVLDAFHEAIKQSLELAAENAKVTGGGFYGKSGKVDECSITNTIEQIKIY